MEEISKNKHDQKKKHAIILVVVILGIILGGLGIYAYVEYALPKDNQKIEVEGKIIDLNSLPSDYTMFKVQSNSMRDEFKAGDTILVKYTKDVKVGDVITFRQDEVIITHRIIQAYNGMYVTKGDANKYPDQVIVSSENIIGKMIMVLPQE